MPVEQLAHCAYPTIPEDHVMSEADKAFADGLEDTTIKFSC
jgi:hypothetical protein